MNFTSEPRPPIQVNALICWALGAGARVELKGSCAEMSMSVIAWFQQLSFRNPTRSRCTVVAWPLNAYAYGFFGLK